MRTASFFTPGLDLTDPRCACIARTHPPRYRGRCFHRLNPTAEMLRDYKAGRLTDAQYAEQYRALVLYWEHPDRVVEFLGADAILLCWEPAGQFCHRRLVAEWLETSLGIVVPEWTVEAKQ